MTWMWIPLYWFVVTVLAFPPLLALFMWVSARQFVLVGSMMSADTFLNAMWFPLVGALAGAVAGLGVAQADQSGGRHGQSWVMLAMLLVLVISPLVAAHLLRRISLTLVHPDGYTARERDRRLLTEQQFLSPAERAWFDRRAAYLLDKGVAVLAERSTLTLRAYVAARSRTYWITTFSVSLVGAGAVAVLALKQSSGWYFLGLAAFLGPTSALPGFWGFDRRVRTVEASEFTACAEFIIKQVETVQVLEVPARQKPCRVVVTSQRG